MNVEKFFLSLTPDEISDIQKFFESQKFITIDYLLNNIVMSVRLHNCLRSINGDYTFITELRKGDFRRYRNFGKNSLDELIGILSNMNIKLQN